MPGHVILMVALLLAHVMSGPVLTTTRAMVTQRSASKQQTEFGSEETKLLFSYNERPCLTLATVYVTY